MPLQLKRLVFHWRVKSESYTLNRTKYRTQNVVIFVKLTGKEFRYTSKLAAIILFVILSMGYFLIPVTFVKFVR